VDADVVIAGEAELFIEQAVQKVINGGRRDTPVESKPHLTDKSLFEPVFAHLKTREFHLNLPSYLLNRGKAANGTKAAQTRGPKLDDLPFPAFDLYPKLQFATIMTSRGCPLRCTFCASHLVSGQYRWRSIDGVIAELDWLHRGLGIREFAFYDDALLTNRDRHFLPLCERIIQNRLQTTFHTPNGLQAKFIDASTARLMWQAGFKTIRLAYESGSEERQRDMSKKVSNESFARAVANLHAAGFGPQELDAYVIMALPGQSLHEILWSMAYVHSLGVGIRLAAFSPIPGTVEYGRAVARGEMAFDADPLLTNNSILPIRLPDVPFETYDRIAQLAKQLNAHLLRTGRPLDSTGDLFKRLHSQLVLKLVQS
jgi:radical SAM superfamily enzyme YgiQ (UPF0313 family)